MTLNKSLLFTSIVILLYSSSCGVKTVSTNVIKVYKISYRSIIPENEKYLRSTYTTVTSYDKDLDKFIFRSYLPEDTTLIFVEMYEDESLLTADGMHTRYYPNGKLRSKTLYNYGIAQGNKEIYHPNGGLLRSAPVNDLGLVDGVVKEYYENGTLRREVTYKEDVMDGPYTEYHSTGEIAEEGIYEENNKVKSTPGQVVLSKPRFGGCEDILDLEERQRCSTDNLLRYVYSNIRYPASDREANNQGSCIFKFTIEKDGNVRNIQSIQVISRTAEQHCRSLIQNMPKWVPGTVDGVPVAVQFTLPIKFKLS